MSLTLENLGDRERFVIAEALALASAYAHCLPADTQFQRDRETMDLLLKTNFPPEQVAYHAIHAAFPTGICVDPYAADKGQTPEHQEYLQTVRSVLVAFDAEEAAA